MKADPDEYRRLDLQVHGFLADVALHDVWIMHLVGGGEGRTIEDLRACLKAATGEDASLAVRALFALRSGLGRVFGWDRAVRAREDSNDDSYVGRLTAAQRAASTMPPGTEDGPFRIVYASADEALSEIRNATVHAFSCFALRPAPDGYRLYWAIYVKPVGPITGAYMHLIDPFRRRVIYPSVIARVERAWRDRFD